MTATPTSTLGFQNFFQATLTGDITASDTDIPLDSIPNSTEGFLVIEPDSTTNREVIFYDSKTSLKVVCPSAADGRGQDDTTAVAHSTGATVIMAPVAAFFEALQSGQSLASNSITTAKINDGAVTNAKLSTSTGEIGAAWQTWSSPSTGITVGNGTETASYCQVGKTVYFRYFYQLGSTSTMTSSFRLVPPVTPHADYGTLGTYTSLGLVKVRDNSAGSSRSGYLRMENSLTEMRPILWNVAATYTDESGMSNTIPFTWATGDGFGVQGFYEAA